MNEKICGMYPPRDELDLTHTDEVIDLTFCLRESGHEGEHIFGGPEGTFLSWESEEEVIFECYDEEEDGDPKAWFLILLEVQKDRAKQLIAIKEPVN